MLGWWWPQSGRVQGDVLLSQHHTSQVEFQEGHCLLIYSSMLSWNKTHAQNTSSLSLDSLQSEKLGSPYAQGLSLLLTPNDELVSLDIWCLFFLLSLLCLPHPFLSLPTPPPPASFLLFFLPISRIIFGPGAASWSLSPLTHCYLKTFFPVFWNLPIPWPRLLFFFFLI